MIVHSGASDHLVDDELIPRLRDSMKDYKKLKEPKIIVTAGNKEVLATATGTMGTHHRSGWAACSSSHLRHDCTWIGAQPFLLRQSDELGSKHHPQDGKPAHAVQQQHFTSAEPAP